MEDFELFVFLVFHFLFVIEYYTVKLIILLIIIRYIDCSFSIACSTIVKVFSTCLEILTIHLCIHYFRVHRCTHTIIVCLTVPKFQYSFFQKPGKWCSVHVRIAHFITKKQKEVTFLLIVVFLFTVFSTYVDNGIICSEGIFVHFPPNFKSDALLTF